MKIKVNGKEQIIAKDKFSVSNLLEANKIERPEMVSVQLNGEFVDKTNYKSAYLKENDEVDFLYFMGGGERACHCESTEEGRSNLKFSTKVLHAKPLKKDPHGSLHVPVYDNVAFEFDTSSDLELAFQGKKPAHMYSRITNPTVEHFEEIMHQATGSFGVIALSSGMAAISNIILTIAQTGDNIVTSKHLFGNTYSLFEYTLKAWGLEARYADLTKPEKLKGLIDKKTKAIFFETITNPQLEVADIRALSKIAKANDVLLIADTTLTPPYCFDSRGFGVDIEVLSSTKYISGGATSVGGLVIDNGTYDWGKNEKLKEDVKKYGPFAFINKMKREVYRNIGSCLSPHNAYLQSLGLETLALRLDQSCENAAKIAAFLEELPKIKRVNYPGLKSSRYYKIVKEQFGSKTGSLLTFDLLSKKECFNFMDKLTLIRRATNLQDNRTLIIHPASTIFCEYDSKLKDEMGVRETMIRLAVGIEDVDDLIGDIRHALEMIRS